ncbi:MAG: hypothetical protein ACM3SS_02755 [Rhodospirillaceae bacterium]
MTAPRYHTLGTATDLGLDMIFDAIESTVEYEFCLGPHISDNCPDLEDVEPEDWE